MVAEPRADFARIPAFGEPVPLFEADLLGGLPSWPFHVAAGRPALLFFFGSAGNAVVVDALRAIHARDDVFNGASARCFGVTVDSADIANGRLPGPTPGLQYVVDTDRHVSAAYGASGRSGYRAFFLLLDALQRVAGQFRADEVEKAIAATAALARLDEQDWAPVMRVRNVFEPAFCQQLIALYEAEGGTPSGFMREVDGKTVRRFDETSKRRRDVTVEDKELRADIVARLSARLLPVLKAGFQYEASKIERYLVACYDSEERGWFRRHRDNTTSGTAHRRFAVSINLNDDFEGGDLTFPEFGGRTYRPPAGGAVIFSCSLLHEVQAVTAGKRYAFLPFLY